MPITHTERRERREKMAREIERGFRRETVCRRYGVSLKTLRDACHEYGVTFPSLKSAK